MLLLWMTGPASVTAGAQGVISWCVLPQAAHTGRAMTYLRGMAVSRGAWAARAVVPVVGLLAFVLAATGIAGAKVVNGCDIKAGAQCPGADLSGLDLESESLARADLFGADLTDAYIARTDMTSINLAEATLTRANIISGSMARATLSGASGSTLYLGDVSLRGARVVGADLPDAKFAGVTGVSADFSGTTLDRLKLEGGDWSRADFTEAVLPGASLTAVPLSATNFNGAELTRATLMGLTANNASFREANLSWSTIREHSTLYTSAASSFVKADLTLALLVGATVRYTNFSRSSLEGLALVDAVVSGSTFWSAEGTLFATGADFTGLQNAGNFLPNSFAGASLPESNFTRADLRGVDFTDANLRGANFTNADVLGTIFDGADMRGVIFPASQLGARPNFGCNKQTKWSPGYAERFTDYCKGKGQRVKPYWCRGDYPKTTALCALCGRICLDPRTGRPTADCPLAPSATAPHSPARLARLGG